MRKKKKVEIDLASNPLFAKFLGFKPRKGDLKRAEILQQTIRCVAEQGIEKTNFESIARLCHTSKAHVAYYYPDKAQLIRSTIEFSIACVQEMTLEYVAKAQGPEHRLEAFIRGTFAWLEQYPHQVRVILLLYSYSAIDSGYQKFHTSVRKLGAERIEAIVAEMKPRHKAAPAYKAKLIQNLMTGNILDWVTTQSPESLAELCEKTILQCYAFV